MKGHSLKYDKFMAACHYDKLHWVTSDLRQVYIKWSSIQSTNLCNITYVTRHYMAD